jgi:COP9 signalosome complex subunit 7
MQETRLEDLVERGRSATGKAAADLVDEATAAPGVLVFGELLDLDGVRALASDPVLAGKLAVLRVFAHGTLPEYRADKSLPPLSPAQELKLRRLTVASLAEKSAVLSYSLLRRALELDTIRELEDLLINECVATGVVRGKLDQKKERFEVHEAMARDVELSKLGGIIASLEAWREDVRAALAAAEETARRAKEASAKETERVENVDAAVAAMTQRLKAEAESLGARASGGGAAAEHEEDLVDAMDADDVRSEIGLKRRR